MTRVAVVGVGSIGSRHARNLDRLGADVITVDPVQKAEYRDFNEIPDVDAVVVATPADSHIEIAAAALARGCDVFIEKPLAVTAEEAKYFAAAAAIEQRIVQVGYNLRFRPELIQLQRRLQVDRPVFARLEFGQRITDWRPGRDYRQTPSVRPHEQGGGILLEASHELDLLLWFFGPWAACFGGRRSLSGLVPESIDYTGAFVEYGDLMVEVSLNMFESGYRRGIRAVHIDGAVTEWNFTDDYGDSYRAEMAHFLDCVTNRRRPLVGLVEGIRALELVDAITASSMQSRAMRSTFTPGREPIWRRIGDQSH